MDSSILTEIKKLLGINDEEYTVFDTDIIVSINAAIGVLNQIGIGTPDFMLVDKNQTWSDFLGPTCLGIQIVKQYIYLRARITFDPPQSSAVLNSYQELIREYEYRLNVLYETTDPEDTTVHVMTPGQIHSLVEGGFEEGDEP